MIVQLSSLSLASRAALVRHPVRARARAQVYLGCCDVAVRVLKRLEFLERHRLQGAVLERDARRVFSGPHMTVAAYLRPSLQGTMHLEPLASRGDDGVGGGGGGITFGGVACQ